MYALRRIAVLTLEVSRVRHNNGAGLLEVVKGGRHSGSGDRCEMVTSDVLSLSTFRTGARSTAVSDRGNAGLYPATVAMIGLSSALRNSLCFSQL